MIASGFYLFHPGLSVRHAQRDCRGRFFLLLSCLSCCSKGNIALHAACHMSIIVNHPQPKVLLTAGGPTRFHFAHPPEKRPHCVGGGTGALALRVAFSVVGASWLALEILTSRSPVGQPPLFRELDIMISLLLPQTWFVL